MSNTNKKSRRRINVIDVIIIILVLALIATGVYKIYSEMTGGQSGRQSNYIVTFECDAEYRSLISYLGSGEAIYFYSDGTILGYLYDEPSDDKAVVYEIVSEADGETAEKGNDDPYIKVRLGGKLKLASNAVKATSGSYYSIEGKNISVGSTLNVYTMDALFTLTVKSIETDSQ